MLIEGRAALFLIATLALGPGVLTNLVLKNHWGRPRPIDVQQFGGAYHFTPWWDPRGDCPNNCSFIAGEPSGAFWTLAPAALAPPELRAVAYGAAIAFGVGVGALRMGAGAHFFSDVVFAGVLMYLVIWTAHGLIYRWPMTRLREPSIERLLTQAGETLRASISALARRLTALTKKSQ
jgi:membrane-associated PAP2 superfamily phosphatase